MIKILVADDHPVVRRGLMQILSEERDMRVAGEANNAVEVLREIRARPWDVVILDIGMPGRSGLDVLAEVKRERPHLPVLILSMHSEDQFGVRVLRAGAAGYMTKESVPAELVKAIRNVFAGKKYISPALAQRLTYEMEASGEQPLHETLSDREFQVMHMIASGKMLKQIAGDLSLSIKTVSTYRTRVLKKMQMKTNAELTIFAMDNQLVIPFRARD